MRTIEAVLEDLVKARKGKKVRKSIALCKEGRRLTAGCEKEAWYGLSLELGRLLLPSRRTAAARARSDDIEQAIHVFREILSGFRGSDNLEKRANAFMGLGWAYYLRSRGKINDNLRKSARAYKRALEYYIRPTDPFTWAMLKDGIGVSYARMTGEHARTYLSKAIQAFVEALEVFTESDYPDERRELLQKLSDAEQSLAEVVDRIRRSGRR